MTSSEADARTYRLRLMDNQSEKLRINPASAAIRSYYENMDIVVCGFTGHGQIEKQLGLPFVDNGEGYNPDAFNWMMNEFDRFVLLHILPFRKKEDIAFVSGMARGFDEIVALYAIQNDIELILAIPNSLHWHMNRVKTGAKLQAIFYEEILENIESGNVFIANKEYQGGPYQYGNFARNQLIVDLSACVYSFKIGHSTGTEDCIRRAKKKKRYAGNIPQLLDYGPDPEFSPRFLINNNTEIVEL